MTAVRWIILGCAGTLCAPAPGAAVDGPEALAARVDARYAQLRDLRADFVQETRIEGFDRILRSSGRVLLKKPGLLRWDYLEPSVEHIYVREDRLDVYVPAHNQVLRGDLTLMAATKAPLRLLQGAGTLTEHFLVQPETAGPEGDGAPSLRLTLLPRTAPGAAPSSLVKVVSEIRPDTYLIHSLALHEASGNVSTFRFSNIEVDTGLDDALFVLNPPEDAVIVDDGFPRR